jgi:hypothetical protein
MMRIFTLLDLFPNPSKLLNFSLAKSNPPIKHYSFSPPIGGPFRPTPSDERCMRQRRKAGASAPASGALQHSQEYLTWRVRNQAG